MTRIKVRGKCEIARHLVLGMSMAVVLLILGFPSVSRAATLTVNSTADAGGTCPGAGCTLRQAIASAVSGDTINFSLPPNSAITLTSGELSINKNLTISGPGANRLTVMRSTAPGTPNFRIVNIAFGNFNVTISGLTIANGNGGNAGGGIINFSTASVTITNCTISGNVAGVGGGIRNSSGTVVITNSTISGNTAQDGGGVSNGDQMVITNSTISGNSGFEGGGIINQGTVTVTNSTISNNSASHGGGMLNQGAGDGIRGRNTIIALNTSPTGPDFSGNLASQGYNLISNTSGITTITGDTTGNQLNVNPILGPLQDNGGPTMTHALLSGSPAIEGGHSSGSIIDQRRLARPVDSPVIPNATGGDGSDIGAYEVQADQLPGCSNINRIVSNNNDGGTDSLRAVIANVCAGSTITFAPNVTGAINLTSGQLAINKTLTINGPGANLLTVQRSGAAGNFRIFNIAAASVIATISGLTIANGNLPDCCLAGGGIAVNLGALILTNSALSGNAAFSGGGISNADGTVTIMNSTISGNTALGDGGGFLNSIGGGVYNSGTLTITNSTLSGNVALDAGASGAGIFTDGETTLTNSTISGNSASGAGGGVHNFSGTVRSRNTIVALNIATFSPDFAGALTTDGFNLIGNNSGATIAPAQFSDQIGTPGSPINPMLGPLQNNGGPTLTRALLAGSPAIDKGAAVIGMTNDQRGSARPYDHPSVPDAPGGDGSDIGAFERQPTDAGSVRAPFDFDGDGKTDIGIFRPAPAEWWIQRSSNGATFATQFGASTDTITPGDFTGDGKADITFFRPSTGFWFVLRSEDFSFFSFPFGTTGDIPAPADFDGDGKTDAAVFRSSNATWFISRSTGGTTIQQFGANGDRPVAADYDGDGRADIAIYRPNVAEWWMLRSSAGLVAVQFGANGDKALPGDFTGDGKADVAFWRPSTGFWFVLRSENFSFFSFPFGTTGDVPAQGDYDGDGRFDATVFRPSNLTWFVSRSSGGTTIVGFGSPGDAPIPAAFVR